MCTTLVRHGTAIVARRAALPRVGRAVVARAGVRRSALDGGCLREGDPGSLAQLLECSVMLEVHHHPPRGGPPLGVSLWLAMDEDAARRIGDGAVTR